MALLTRTGALPPAAVDRARRRVWLAFTLFLAAMTLGFRWDRAWHTTHPFEEFWSPPHLFIYTMFALTAYIVAGIAFTPRLRAPFAGSMRLPLLRARLPGALILAGGGLGVVVLAGLMDSIWHTTFGLDETGWSLPHAMLGWGTLVTFLGLISCRLALRAERPLGRATRVLLAALALSFVTGVLLGPFGGNPTAEHVRRVAAIPVLADEEAFQHTTRIYLEANLTRGNPLFVPLAAFAAGAALALARVLVPRTRMLLLLVALVTLLSLSSARGSARYLDLLDDPRAWLPLPLLPAVLAVVLLRHAGAGERVAWAAAGLVYGVVVAGIWRAPLPLALLAAPAMVAGMLAGKWAGRTLHAPDERGVRALLATALTVPIITGAIDLLLRTRIT